MAKNDSSGEPEALPAPASPQESDGSWVKSLGGSGRHVSTLVFPEVGPALWKLVPSGQRDSMGPDGRPYSEIVTEFAEQIAIISAVMADRPRTSEKKVSLSSTLSELNELSDAVKALKVQILDLHSPARTWLDQLRDVGVLHGKDGRPMPTGLALFSALTTVERAIENLSTGWSPAPKLSGLDGKAKPRAAEVTVVAAIAFKTITGQEPTKINREKGFELMGAGPFVAFVADLFKALGIDAKAASQVAAFRARQAREAQ
jgi:hypothetical protein